MIEIDASRECCSSPWEEAYRRFETPEQEIRKFVKRLRRAGADHWPRDARIVELFCGRGNGLHALTQLGFTHVEGADLSASLLAQYDGPAECFVCDCRRLPFADESKDILVIQGGLHHLPTLPNDLEQVLAEMHRVVRRGGTVMLVEPWLDSFLSVVHFACNVSLCRQLVPKLDALATMIEHERSTYDAWLSQPAVIGRLLQDYFEPDVQRVSAGKLLFVGRRRT